MSAPSTDLTRLTIATLFNTIGDQLAGIAPIKVPMTLSDHLLSLFMATTEFYHGNDITMPPEILELLKDMYQAAHCPNGARTLELMRAVDVLSHRPALRNDPVVRLAISDANVALLAVVV